MKKWLDSIEFRPERERRAAMKKYADLQVFKLKVICVMAVVSILLYLV